MRKLVFLGVILITGIAFAGGIACGVNGGQQQALSEAEVRNIVGQEVARQLASIDDLTVSALYIKNEDGMIVAQLESFGVMGGQLTFFDSDGNQVAQFNDHGLYFADENGKSIAIFGTLKHTSGDRSGLLILSDTEGEVTFYAP